MKTIKSQPRASYKLKKFQEPAVEYYLNFLRDPFKKGCILQGPTGCGKTIILLDALKKAQEKGEYLGNPDRDFQLHPIFLLCPKNAIVQWRRMIHQYNIKGVEIIAPDSLRASHGENWITWEKQWHRGELLDIPIWDKSSAPDLIIIDECQSMKNVKAQRTAVMQAYVNQKLGKTISMSATLFQRPAEASFLIMSTGFKSSDTINQYINAVSPNGPLSDSPIAIRRIKEDLEEDGGLFIVKNVRFPFKPIVRNLMMQLSPEQKPIFDRAYLDYLEELAKQGRHEPEGVRRIWVAQLKFRQIGELLKAFDLAKIGIKSHKEDGKAIIFASNFVPTLRKIYTSLVELGVNPDRIAFLVGSTDERTRQKNIDKFQHGKADYFLTTLKSGGAALNLQHEFNEALPRHIILPPTWSPYEMVQVLGRAQRINNLSPVTQSLTWFEGTIEEKVALRLNTKLDCIKELMDRKNNYLLNIFNQTAENDMVDTMLSKEIMNEILEDDEDSLFDSSLLDGED